MLGGDDLYIAKTPDAYADNPGTVRIIPASDMDLAAVDNWYVDSPDQRYSSDDGEIYGEVNLSNTEPVYLKAAPDKPIDNPQTGDNVTLAIFVIIGLMTGFGLLLRRSLRVRA